MPYSKAHWFVLALLPVTLLAFWPSYFGILREAPLAHHLHGVTSTLWILLIAGQSVAIHSRRLPLHRTAGVTDRGVCVRGAARCDGLRARVASR